LKARNSGMIFAGKLAPEPGAGVGPVALDRPLRHVEDVGDLGNGQASKEAQLDHLGRARLHGSKPLEGRVEAQELFEVELAFGGREERFSQRDPLARAASLLPSSSAGVA
jgi:hypothetical protein